MEKSNPTCVTKQLRLRLYNPEQHHSLKKPCKFVTQKKKQKKKMKKKQQSPFLKTGRAHVRPPVTPTPRMPPSS